MLNVNNETAWGEMAMANAEHQSAVFAIRGLAAAVVQEIDKLDGDGKPREEVKRRVHDMVKTLTDEIQRRRPGLGDGRPPTA